MIEEKLSRAELAKEIVGILINGEPRTVEYIQAEIARRTGQSVTVAQVHNAFIYIKRPDENKGAFAGISGSRLVTTRIDVHAEGETHRKPAHKLTSSRSDVRAYVVANIKFWGTLATTMLQQMRDTNALREGDSLDDLIAAVEALMPRIYEKHPEPAKFCDAVQQRTGVELCVLP